jgi:hypothetical protein
MLVQFRFSSNGQLSLFPGETHRRDAVHKLAEVVGGQLVMFGFVNNHGHPLVQTCDPGTLQRTLGSGLSSVAAAPLEQVWSDRVKSRRHALSLVDYLINQVLKHRIPVHPGVWTGSGFQDAVGARIVDGLELKLFEELQLTEDSLFKMAGLPPGCLRPASDGMIRALGAMRLKAAAAAAFAADPDLKKNDVPSVRARRVTANLARVTGMDFSEVSWVLDVKKKSVSRMAEGEVEPSWIHATRLRLGLEEAVRQHIEKDWLRRAIEELAARKLHW